MSSTSSTQDLHCELEAELVRYKPEKIIGEGKTATVYRAIRTDSRGHSRQTVALKVLKSRESVPWLCREFEILSQIDSAHCVRVLGWENLKIGSALVLEWIDGVTLFELASRYPISEEILNEIVAQAQAGLQALHECGLHHGDVSPVNLLIDREGGLKIVDFASEPPSSGIVHGTPAYLAPEVWRGGATSAASDLFSLGLISIDLESSFSQTPRSTQECDARALAKQCGEGLLAKEPGDRQMRAVASTGSARATLGQFVCDILAERAKMQVQTAALSIGGEISRVSLLPSSLARLAIVILILAMAVAVPVQATAPLENDAEKDYAVLIVRAQKWLELSLNGKSIGYAPFKLKGLRAGPHRLCWRNKAGSGEIRLDLQSGETKEMGESEISHHLKR